MNIKLTWKDWASYISAAIFLLGVPFSVGVAVGSIGEKEVVVKEVMTPEQQTKDNLAFKKLGYHVGYSTGACEALFKLSPEAFKDLDCLGMLKRNKPHIMQLDPEFMEKHAISDLLK